MRPTISQLRGWSLDSLQRAWNAADDNAEDLNTSLDAARRTFDQVQPWEGATKTSARRRSDEEFDHGQEIRNLVFDISDEARNAERQLRTLQDRVLAFVRTLGDTGYTVSDTGTVTHPSGGTEAGVATTTLQNLLNEIDRVDTAFGKKLHDIADMLTESKDGQPGVTGPDGRRADPDDVVTRLAGMSPDERATALARMSPADIQRLIVANPEEMGRMNGVPFKHRIEANEINIRNALAAEEAKNGPNSAKAGKLQSMLDPANFRSLDAVGRSDTKTERKWVLFRDDDVGRSIEMFGEMTPDKKGVGVFIPGTTAHAFDTDGTFKRGYNMAQQSNSAMFVFMDGKFPPDLAHAANPVYASDMAARLKTFGHEVDREVGQLMPGKPVTYLGHSYGGGVLGTAEQLGLRADRVAHLSSAGTGIYPRGYDVPNPHVQRFSMTAPEDPIQVPQNANWRNSMGQHPVTSDPDKLPGVTVMDTGNYSDGKRVQGLAGHQNYLNDPGSDGFKNIVAVLSGGQPKLRPGGAGPDIGFDRVEVDRRLPSIPMPHSRFLDIPTWFN